LYPNQIITAYKQLYLFLSCLCLTGLLLLVSTNPVGAQVQDTVVNKALVHKHSPQKAVLYSFICPGLGQIYNKKYWKLPLIYGAGGTFAYYVAYNQLKYTKYRDAYINGQPNVPAMVDGSLIDYDNLPVYRDYYRRYRDLSVLGLGAMYLLTIVDAMVDAYFFTFDVSDDLTMHLQPALIQGPGVTASLGLRINLGF
jgi:hypothetical protein